VSGAVVRLPPLLVLSDRQQCERAGSSLIDVVRRVCAALTPLAVVFREKDLPSPQRLRLAEQVAALTHVADVPLIVASDHDLARRVGAAAVHLAASDPVPSSASPMPHGRSCHDGVELRSAAADGAAYATVSPIFLTDSKPGYGPALGVTALATLAGEAGDLPLYALGGVTAERVRACLAAGATGVAVMGAVMTADDPASVVSALAAQLLGARS